MYLKRSRGDFSATLEMTHSPMGVGAWRAHTPHPVMPSSALKELGQDRVRARVAEASRRDSDVQAVVKVYLKRSPGDFSARSAFGLAWSK